MVFVYKIFPPYNSIYFNTVSRIWMNEELNWTGREKIYVYLFNSLRYIAANWRLDVTPWTKESMGTHNWTSGHLYNWTCYKSTFHKFLKVSEATFNAWGRAATERSRLVSPEWIFNHIKNSRGKKWLTYAVSGETWNITHCPTGQLSWRHSWNFRPVNFASNRYEKS